MDKHVFLRSKIRDYISDAKKRNCRLSLRSVAKRLGVSPSTLCEFMLGKRSLSQEKIDAVFEFLQPTKEEIDFYKNLVLVGKKEKIRVLSKEEIFFNSKNKAAFSSYYRYVFEKDCASEQLLLLDSKTFFRVIKKIERFETQLIKIVEQQDELSEKKIYDLSLRLLPSQSTSSHDL